MASTGALARRRVLRFALGSGAVLATGVSQAKTAPSLEWQDRLLLGFGTTLRLRAADHESARTSLGLNAAVRAIRHVERQMSLFDPNSAVARLNKFGVLHRPDPDLLAVLRLASEVSRKSQGAFDVTVQPLWQAWAKAQGNKQIPTQEALEVARAKINWQALIVRDDKIEFALPGMAITLNGIAQGYAADLAKQALQAHGIKHALLDTGEWTSLGTSPNGRPWTLGIEDPQQTNQVKIRIQSDNRSLATSSDVHYVFTEDRKHHHILDPGTGRSPTNMASVTVAAPSCALADALTKVMFMGTIEQAQTRSKHWGVDVLAVNKSGRWLASPGMPVA